MGALQNLLENSLHQTGQVTDWPHGKLACLTDKTFLNYFKKYNGFLKILIYRCLILVRLTTVRA